LVGREEERERRERRERREKREKREKWEQSGREAGSRGKFGGAPRFRTRMRVFDPTWCRASRDFGCYEAAESNG
jgi:hypothetical protein